MWQSIASILAVLVVTMSEAAKGASWKPATGMSWQIQLSGSNYSGLIAAKPQVVIVDMDVVSKFKAQADKAGFRRSAYKLVCYFSIGTYEPGRVAADKLRGLDWKKLETSVGGGGKLYAGKLAPPFQEELWLLLNTSEVRRALVGFMSARLDGAVSAGCDGVDMDNVDAYDNVKPAGRVTVQHELAYVGAMMTAAHSRGLAAGLKNALDLLPKTLPDGQSVVATMDWYVNERCAAFKECGAYRQAGVPATVPVWSIEYCDARALFGAGNPNVHPDCFCNAAAKDPRFSVLIKDVALRKVGLNCTAYCARPSSRCTSPPSSCFSSSPANACAKHGVL